MKRINKRREPARLREWKKNNSQFPDANYDSHQFPVAAVNAALVAEQGGICAYTMMRISEETSHNEHLKPRSVSKNEVPRKYHETTDYNNLVACYPNTSQSTSRCPYGAEARGADWDPKLMITPLMGNCEQRFVFKQNGDIACANPGDAAEEWTINTLVLDHDELNAMRKAAILAAGLSALADRPLNAKSARELASQICNRQRDGLFVPFCVAIKQVATTYADDLERKRRQREFARQSKARRGKQK